MPELAVEGLDAARLATLARRLRRADEALEAAVDGAALAARDGEEWTYDTATFFALPEEVRLRLLGRALAVRGDEGPVELAKLETLLERLEFAKKQGVRARQTLAGALVTLAKAVLTVERAPPRRKALTKHQPAGPPRVKSR